MADQQAPPAGPDSMIDALRDNARTAGVVSELVRRGPEAVPALLEALERRDVEMRRLVFEAIQQILNRQVSFDPYAPESLRRHQLMLLREQWLNVHQKHITRYSFMAASVWARRT